MARSTVYIMRWFEEKKNTEHRTFLKDMVKAEAEAELRIQHLHNRM